MEGMGFEGSLSLSAGGRGVEWEAVYDVLLRKSAPTRAVRREVKVAFFEDMESFLSSVPLGEEYLILGNFNIRVRSRECVKDQWESVRGPHGYGAINDAGKELLSFLSVHRATVCDTRFKNKAIHQQTWQYPKSKQWSSI